MMFALVFTKLPCAIVKEIYDHLFALLPIRNHTPRHCSLSLI